jgi:hypothetical protein
MAGLSGPLSLIHFEGGRQKPWCPTRQLKWEDFSYPLSVPSKPWIWWSAGQTRLHGHT